MAPQQASLTPTLRNILLVLLLAVLAALIFYFWQQQARPAWETGSDRPPSDGRATVSLATWNIQHFGASKDDDEIAFIADVVAGYDVLTIQEVSTSPPGAQAVARLVDALERKGADWDYALSDPTTGNGTERYAYLWKPSRLRLVGPAWLEASLADALDREPYLARFETAAGQRMLLASFHAVPTNKNPSAENVLLSAIHRRYPDDHVLIMGDFNLPQRRDAFDGLKAAGYVPVLVGQKTSLRRKRRDGEHLASEYDNIFYEQAPLRAVAAGVVDFTGSFRTLREARKISDHIPVYMEIGWN